MRLNASVTFGVSRKSLSVASLLSIVSMGGILKTVTMQTESSTAFEAVKLELKLTPAAVSKSGVRLGGGT